MTALLYVVVLYTAVMVGMAAGGAALGGPSRLPRPWPLLISTVAALTALCALAQAIHPALLTLCERDASALASGQWWCLVTPLLFQDGGVAGTLFNLVTLCLVGVTAERLLARWQWLLLYLGTGLTSEVVAYTLLPHQGSAGNSVATFGLAAGLLVLALTMGSGRQRGIGLVGLLAGLLLLALRDLHGAAFAIGSLGALVVIGRRRTRADNSLDRPSREVQ